MAIAKSIQIFSYFKNIPDDSNNNYKFSIQYHYIYIYIHAHFYLLLLHACNELINDDWKHKVSCMDYLIIIKDYN